LLNEFRTESGFEYPLNIECVPAERANVILCKKDEMLFGNKYMDFIYANQWIGLDKQCTIQEKIKLGSILDKKCNGGQISHVNLEAPFVDKEQAWDLLNKMAKDGVIYFAYNVRTNVCEDGHGFFGDTCPVCGKPVVDTFQRVVGFLTNRASYSKERKREFDARQWFDLND
jgi:ribonucleoside-triphosphate reductase